MNIYQWICVYICYFSCNRISQYIYAHLHIVSQLLTFLYLYFVIDSMFHFLLQINDLHALVLPREAILYSDILGFFFFRIRCVHINTLFIKFNINFTICRLLMVKRIHFQILFTLT